MKKITILLGVFFCSQVVLADDYWENLELQVEVNCVDGKSPELTPTGLFLETEYISKWRKVPLDLAKSNVSLELDGQQVRLNTSDGKKPLLGVYWPDDIKCAERSSTQVLPVTLSPKVGALAVLTFTSKCHKAPRSEYLGPTWYRVSDLALTLSVPGEEYVLHGVTRGHFGSGLGCRMSGPQSFMRHYGPNSR